MWLVSGHVASVGTATQTQSFHPLSLFSLCPRLNSLNHCLQPWTVLIAAAEMNPSATCKVISPVGKQIKVDQSAWQ